MGFRHISECGLAEPYNLQDGRQKVQSSPDGWKTVPKEYYDALKRMQPGISEDEGYYMLKCSAPKDRNDSSDEDAPHLQRKRRKSDTE